MSFRLGAVPVRVDAWLPLMGVMLGVGVGRGLLGVVAAAASFVTTVFVHELAHTMAMRSFGAAAEVHLTLFRSTLGARIATLSPIRRIVASLAGPAASLGLGVAIMALARTHPPASEVTAGALRYFGFINLAWGLLNTLPVLPLDAGHALVALLDRTTKGRGEQPARWISIGIALALGLAAVHARMLVPTLFCGILAFQNARALRTHSDSNRDAILSVHLQAAFAAVERGEADLAIRHCRKVLAESTDRRLRRDAVRLLAYAYATSNDWRNLMQLLESGGAGALAEGELEKFQRVARELGRSEDAQRMGLLRGLRPWSVVEKTGASRS